MASRGSPSLPIRITNGCSGERESINKQLAAVEELLVLDPAITVMQMVGNIYVTGINGGNKIMQAYDELTINSFLARCI